MHQHTAHINNNPSFFLASACIPDSSSLPYFLASLLTTTTKNIKKLVDFLSSSIVFLYLICVTVNDECKLVSSGR
ncbi:MAG: hypothetical protein J3R72DRAFT_174161 [Linnemannia gamsii]|nr:MAG: hypothetical protein J3R72DRAFT_174161 [Linnemannia gamsii]